MNQGDLLRGIVIWSSKDLWYKRLLQSFAQQVLNIIFSLFQLETQPHFSNNFGLIKFFHLHKKHILEKIM